MAKDRQMVVRLDNELAALMETTATELHRSRGIVICAAMHVFAALTAKQRAEAIEKYLKWHDMQK